MGEPQLQHRGDPVFRILQVEPGQRHGPAHPVTQGVAPREIREHLPRFGDDHLTDAAFADPGPRHLDVHLVGEPTQ